MKKTNAVRTLDKMNVDYSLVEYNAGNDVSAAAVAERIGIPLGQIYKTLVVRGDKTGIIIASVPGDRELDLKALAKVSGNKKIEMVALEEIKPLTGYVRGAVSPFGMKKVYKYYLDRSILQYEKIYVSAGAWGLQIFLPSESLIETTKAFVANIC